MQILENHSWTLCTGHHISNLRIQVFPGTDTQRLHSVIKSMLAQVCVSCCYVAVAKFKLTPVDII